MANLRKNANWPADRVERWPVAKLVPNARNARTHSDEQVAQLAASIEEWGWTIPGDDRVATGRLACAAGSDTSAAKNAPASKAKAGASLAS
jgi:hypothetical protein